VEDSSVIPAAECVADLVQRRLGMFARQVHGHLSRESDVGRTPLTGHIREADIEMLGHFPLDLIDRDDFFGFFLEDIPKEVLYDLFGYLPATQRSE
jgi:hypothetical protein